MKIGILTQRLRVNFGGLLQNFALQQVLISLGHNVETINPLITINNHSYCKRLLSICKRIIKKYIFNNNKTVIFYEKKLLKTEPIIRKNTDKFVKKYISVREIESFQEIKKEDYNALIAGSDQVWRGGKAGEGLGPYFFDFAEGWNIKRIAYAASFGVDHWFYSPALTKVYKKLILQFNAISVREHKAVDMIKEGFGINATHVLDPTFLIDKSLYHQIVENANLPNTETSLLVYILDESEKKRNFIEQISKKEQLPIKNINAYPDDIWRPIEERIQPSVEEWLKSFMDAKFIITDSFHACVFSILFHKDFIVIENSKRGASRMRELLEDFSLNDRIFKENDLKINYINNLRPINYEIIDKVIEKRKEFSINFLKKALS